MGMEINYMGKIASVHNFFNALNRQNILRKSINTTNAPTPQQIKSIQVF